MALSIWYYILLKNWLLALADTPVIVSIYSLYILSAKLGHSLQCG